MKSWGVVLVALTIAALFIGVSPVMAATGSGYVDWSQVATMPGQGSSPHGGYSTSTVKCAVCHAVHLSGGGNPDSELLLPTSAADACTYCHVNTASSYTQVYGGDPVNYNGADNSYGHNVWLDGNGVVQGVSCTKCHSVHAAESAVVSNTALSQKMLRKLSSPDPVAGQIETTDGKDAALTKWCAGCHFSLGGSYYYPDHQWSQSPVASTSHIMTTATATFDNPAASFNGRVAFKDSSYCSSCHSSGYSTAAFPHYTTGNRMLESATDASATASPASKSGEDGVCLRCHRDGVGNGIGSTF